MNEEQLVQRIIDGDPKAAKYLVENYQVMVRSAISKYLRGQDDINDIAQEVFFEIFRSIKRFEGKSSLSTWIYRICITRSLNFIRREKKHLHPDYPEEKDQLSVEESPDKNLIESERRKILQEALKKLPESQHLAIVLYSYEEKSYQEIAELMQKSISSVESLIFRARRNLQKILAKENLQNPI